MYDLELGPRRRADDAAVDLEQWTAVSVVVEAVDVECADHVPVPLPTQRIDGE
jgi:hypothetical protein